MKATKQACGVRLQSENPLETRAMVELHGYSPRSSGIMPDDSRAIDLAPDEVESFCASISTAPVPEWIKREIYNALNPHLEN